MILSPRMQDRLDAAFTSTNNRGRTSASGRPWRNERPADFDADIEVILEAVAISPSHS